MTVVLDYGVAGENDHIKDKDTHTYTVMHTHPHGQTVRPLKETHFTPI